MDIQEILQLAPSEQIKALKSGRGADLPNVEQIQKWLDPKKHAIFDTAKRADKMVKTDSGLSPEPVARIGLALQKLIIKRAVSFLFGNPVQLNCETQTDTQTKILQAIQLIFDEVKIHSFNRKIARELFSCCEVAELWYPLALSENEIPKYGIQAQSKLRVKLLSPLLGDKLFPYFDEFGDMVAFSREYAISSGNKKSLFFETYTAGHIFRYDISQGEPVLVLAEKNPLGKIPVVYARQEQTEFADVQDLIERLEKLLSNFADTNDYHGSPKIFAKGNITGFSKKGEAGTIIQGDQNTSVEYLTWQHAPESVKLEIDTLLRMIYTLTQTPDISFESVKGLGTNTSGQALKMLFLDAHLKVADHLEVFDEYLQRRISILKAYISSLNISLKNQTQMMMIETEITPFMIDDYADKLEFVMTATGNKPVLSQKTGIKLAGLVNDTEQEYKNLQQEEMASVTEASF